MWRGLSMVVVSLLVLAPSVTIAPVATAKSQEEDLATARKVDRRGQVLNGRQLQEQRRELLTAYEAVFEAQKTFQEARPHWIANSDKWCVHMGPGCPGWGEFCKSAGLCDELGREILLRDATRGISIKGNLAWEAATFLVKITYCATKIEYEGYQAGIEDPLDGPSGFKKMEDCVSDLPFSTDLSARWTDWFDRDDPSGQGDWETVGTFKEKDLVCAAPVAAECTTLDGRDWSKTGQKIECSPLVGAVCRNNEQTGRRCLDYRVRFLCR